MYIGILLWVQVCHMGRQRSGEVRVGQALLSCLSYVPAGTSAARQLPTLLRSLLQINLKLPEDGCMAPRGKARFFDRLTSLDWKVILALVLWTGDCNRQATQGGTFTDARRDGKLSERWLLLIVFFFNYRLQLAHSWGHLEVILYKCYQHHCDAFTGDFAATGQAIEGKFQCPRDHDCHEYTKASTEGTSDIGMRQCDIWSNSVFYVFWLYPCVSCFDAPRPLPGCDWRPRKFPVEGASTVGQ